MSEKLFSESLNISYVEEAEETNFEEFKRVVRSRRSVRGFQAKEIPENIVRECLELALLAPNSSNLQMWEFHWVKSEEKKKLLTKYCFNQPAARTAPTLIVCVARTDTWKQNARRMTQLLKSQNAPQGPLDYYEKLVPIAYSAGPGGLFFLIKRVLVFFAGFFTVIAREPLSFKALQMWAHRSCALACQNLMLAFRAAGYDTCPMEGFDESRVKKLLHLSRGESVVMVIAAGLRTSKGVYGPRMRFPSDEFIKEI